MEKIIAKLKEPSTWRGLVIFIGWLGYSVTAEDMQTVAFSIGTIVLAVYAGINILRKEK